MSDLLIRFGSNSANSFCALTHLCKSGADLISYAFRLSDLIWSGPDLCSYVYRYTNVHLGQILYIDCIHVCTFSQIWPRCYVMYVLDGRPYIISPRWWIIIKHIYRMVQISIISGLDLPFNLLIWNICVRQVKIWLYLCSWWQTC